MPASALLPAYSVRNISLLDCPRILIAAPSSGAGKTSLSLGLMTAFTRRGLTVQPFKAGPDYIDAALHAASCGRPAGSFDPRLQGRKESLSLFTRRAQGADICVVEGAMGFFDGCQTGRSSSYDSARMLAAPVVLVLDARAAAESLAAVALGFIRFRRKTGIQGFLLNRVGSPRHAESASLAIERATGLPVWGAIPKDASLAMPERHLGLTLAEGNPGFEQAVTCLGKMVQDHCNLDAILGAARAAPPLAIPSSLVGRLLGQLDLQQNTGVPGFRIAVAQDEGFSFYYEDNLDILRSLGAELVPFSPLHDMALPAGSCGLYLGGGYPELYADALAANTAMRQALAEAVTGGMPLWAECGGYMYLCQGVEDTQGNRWPGVGVVPWSTIMTGHRMALGYHEGRSLGNCSFMPRGSDLRGHCFHWSRMDGADETRAALALTKSGNPVGLDGFAKGSIFASYLHVHFAGNMGAARRFTAACSAYDRKTTKHKVTVHKSSAPKALAPKATAFTGII